MKFLEGAKIIKVDEHVSTMCTIIEIITTKGKIIIRTGDSGTMMNPEPVFEFAIKRKLKRRKKNG